jgi:hypothetical protein
MQRLASSKYRSPLFTGLLAISSAWFEEACISERSEDWRQPRKPVSSRAG